MPYHHRLSIQLVIYAIVGVAQLAVDAFLFLVLVKFGFDALLANLASRLAAGLSGYLCHAFFTFTSSWPTHDLVSFSKFLAWWLTCTVIGGLIMAQALGLFEQLATIAGIKIAVELAVALASFLVLRNWVFSPRNSPA